MNPRIKQLAKQAGGHISIRNLASNPVQHIESVELWDDKIEKFAQLIVQEVFDCIAGEGFEVYGPVTQKVKEHFGVEE
jgi:hypothetical protein